MGVYVFVAYMSLCPRMYIFVTMYYILLYVSSSLYINDTIMSFDLIFSTYKTRHMNINIHDGLSALT